MSDPIKVENAHQERKARPTTAHRPNNFKLNPTSFDWFLEGIDKTRLDALTMKLEQTIMRDNQREDHAEMTQQFQ
jgi:hypothetical protein